MWFQRYSGRRLAGSMVVVLLLVSVGVWQFRGATPPVQSQLPQPTALLPTTAASPLPIKPRHILFATGSDVYRTPAERADEHLLVRLPEDDHDVAFSPDGTQIAFASDRTGDGDIYVAQIDGTHTIRLTRSPAAELLPKWSPDGKEIAFLRSTGHISADVYLIASDGTNLRQLTHDQSLEDITWSPTGTQLALVGRDGADLAHFAIFMVGADGTNFRRFASGGALSWSPDGTQVVFAYAYQIFRINANGTGGVNLTEGRPLFGGYNGDDPAWSPDGSTIAFISKRQLIPTSSRDLPSNVWLMNPDGTNLRRLTDITYYSDPSDPQWSPDGRQLLFYQGTPGGQSNYSFTVMNADGTNQHQVGGGSHAVWDPHTK